MGSLSNNSSSRRPRLHCTNIELINKLTNGPKPSILFVALMVPPNPGDPALQAYWAALGPRRWQKRCDCRSSAATIIQVSQRYLRLVSLSPASLGIRLTQLAPFRSNVSTNGFRFTGSNCTSRCTRLPAKHERLSDLYTLHVCPPSELSLLCWEVNSISRLATTVGCSHR